MKLPESTPSVRCGGQQVVERGRQHPRVDPAVGTVGLVRQRQVVPPALGRDPLGDLLGALPRPARDGGERRPSRSPRRRRARPGAPAAARRSRPGRRRPARPSRPGRSARRAGWSTSSATRPTPRRGRRPRSARRPAAWRTRPEIPSAHGSPANSPFATAEVASSAPQRSASAATAGPACRAPRPAMNTGRSAPSSSAARADTDAGSARGAPHGATAGSRSGIVALRRPGRPAAG